MSEERFVLGINRTQDASVCLLGSKSVLCSTQKERLTRKKHDTGALGDFRDFYLERIPGLRNPLDLVVECYSSDTEIGNLEQYHAELIEVLNFRGAPRVIQMSHHFAHLYSSFFLAPFNDAAVMILDFQGSPVKAFSEDWEILSDNLSNLLEVSSFYHCTPNGIACVGKQIWDGNRRRPVGLGCFYNRLTTTVFPGFGNEGKMMGLAPYGDPARLQLPPLIVEAQNVIIPDEWQAMLANLARFGHFRYGHGSFH